MRAVTLTSGGLDSALMLLLAHRQGVEQYPLFIDYGQRSTELEWLACRRVCAQVEVKSPTRMSLPGFGQVIPSGLTRTDLDVNADAFLPCRNLMMLVAAAGYAQFIGARYILMGLLTENSCIFPDQSDEFIRAAEGAIRAALGGRIEVLLPLRDFDKRSVVMVARREGLSGTYSCHAGGTTPCGRCVACLEFGDDSDYYATLTVSSSSSETKE